MPHPRLSLRNGPSHLQSALLLGRSSNNRLVIGGVLQLELMVTMISDTLTSLSYETGMYVYSNVRDTNNIVIAYRRSPTTQLLISTSLWLSRKHKPDDGSFIAKADPFKSLPGNRKIFEHRPTLRLVPVARPSNESIQHYVHFSSIAFVWQMRPEGLNRLSRGTWRYWDHEYAKLHLRGATSRYHVCFFLSNSISSSDVLLLARFLHDHGSAEWPCLQPHIEPTRLAFLTLLVSVAMYLI